jgi:hypothetical protein
MSRCLAALKVWRDALTERFRCSRLVSAFLSVVGGIVDSRDAVCLSPLL